MPAPFGSSARRLPGDVRGSAERAKRPHSASSGGFQPSRKSFFQSLDADERAALLKVAPSLRCARRRRPRARTSAVSRPSVSLSARPARPSRRRVEARHATDPSPTARALHVRPGQSDVPDPRAAGTSRPRPGRRRLRSRRPRVESRGDADARREDDVHRELGLASRGRKARGRHASEAASPAARVRGDDRARDHLHPRSRPAARGPAAGHGAARGAPASRAARRRGGARGRLSRSRVRPRAHVTWRKREALRFGGARRARGALTENETFRASAETARRRRAVPRVTSCCRAASSTAARRRWAMARHKWRGSRSSARASGMLRELAVTSGARGDNVLLRRSSSRCATRSGSSRGDLSDAGAGKLYLANRSRWRERRTRVSLRTDAGKKSWTSCSPRTCWRARSRRPRFRRRFRRARRSSPSRRRRQGTRSDSRGLVGPRRRPGRSCRSAGAARENAALRKSLAKAHAEAAELRERRALAGDLAAARADDAKARTLRRSWRAPAPVVAGGARGRAGGVRAGEGHVRRVARAASAGAAQTVGAMTARRARRRASGRRANRARRAKAREERRGKVGRRREILIPEIRRRKAGPRSTRRWRSSGRGAAAATSSPGGTGGELRRDDVASARTDGWVPAPAGGRPRRGTRCVAERAESGRRPRAATTPSTSAWTTTRATTTWKPTGARGWDGGEAGGFRVRRRDPGQGIAGSRASAAASPGTVSGTPGTPGPPDGPGGAEDGSGEDFSMDGIEAYIANLQALHRKSELAVKTPRGKR